MAPVPRRPTAAAVIVAAGRGERFGSATKALVPLLGRPMLARVLDAVERAEGIGAVVVVVGPHTRHEIEALVAAEAWGKVRAIVTGGERRQDSVAAGVAAVPAGTEVVVVHDAARPLAPPALFDRCVAAAAATGAAVAAVPVADTLKRVADGRIAGTVDREGLWAAQTPQAFRRGLLADAIARCADRPVVTDEAGLCETLGIPVAVIPGSPSNLKVTRPEDVAVAEALLRATEPDSARSPAPSGPIAPRGTVAGHRSGPGGASGERRGGSGRGPGRTRTVAKRAVRRHATAPDSRCFAVRTGIGYDVHRFAPGRRLVLGGVEIPHPLGLDGHSDADVLLHAVADALLGAAALGDIGRHFPPDDPRFAGADSRELLREVGRLVAAAGFAPVNVDATVVAEAPRIGPHAAAMRAAIGACLGMPEAAIGVKATTNEGLGFVGRGEGIAALATATIAPLATATIAPLPPVEPDDGPPAEPA